MFRRELLHGLTIRAALFLGFGVTLFVWLLSGLYFTRGVADVEDEVVAVNARYMHAQDLLSTVRAQMLLGSVYVRDALLDPNPKATDEYRRHVEETFDAAEEALQQYVPIVDPAVEHERIADLRNQLEQFRHATLEVLSSDSKRWPTEARTLLRSRIVPRREGIIRVSEEVQALNRTTFIGQQAATTQIYRAMHQQIWIQLGLALAASFAIGFLAIRHVGQLEKRLRQQQIKDAENTRNLQRLSAQLISVQEEERRTIARELHDEVGQVLTALKVELTVAERAMQATGRAAQAIAAARSLTDGALHTIRNLSQLLRPAVLDDLGLPSAVASHLREVGRRHEIRTELLQDRMEQRLPSDVEAAAYRIVQEALTNIVRHAHATSCRVYLQRLAHTVVITVEDDGCGFDIEGLENGGSRGLGILGIRERVALLGGTVRLESTPGNGTRLTVELPFKAPRSPDRDPPAVAEATPAGALHG